MRGVSTARIGQRVWCFGAQSYRPFGTAAEFVVVPETNVGRLPDRIDHAQGACLGIPGITGHRAVHAGGDPAGKSVLVQGGAGAVGVAAIAIARFSGARAIATVRSSAQEVVAQLAGADVVIRTADLSADEIVARILAVIPDGADHVVEVAFDANIAVDEQVLRQGGSIAAYATHAPQPAIPFWPLVFKNVQVNFLGSDDFTPTQKAQAALDLTAALEGGWTGYPIAHRFALEDVALAHLAVEGGSPGGRVILELAAEADDESRTVPHPAR